MTDAEWATAPTSSPSLWSAERIIAAERPTPCSRPWAADGAQPRGAAREAGNPGKYGCQLIGAQLDAIEKAEDRQRFKDCMTGIGIDVPRSGVAHSWTR